MNVDLTTLQGYKDLELIGGGGFGTVYRARQTSINREIAIKIIKSEHANKPEFIRRFESEAQLVARLEHPHIVPLYDYWRDTSGAYLVMRYLKGGSVHDELQKGAYELTSIATLLDQIASALDFAHRQQVIHRDIKPGNILLDEDGNAYLGDFGIAKDLTVQDSHTNPDALVGSLDYISPEQARSEPVTGRTDIYSLGVVLFELLTGDHPFKETSRVERLYKHINDPLPEIDNLPDDKSEQLNIVVQTATQKDPAKRYPDVLSMALAFRDAIGETVTEELRVIEQLTLREHEILSLLATGISNQDIADSLFVTKSNVRWHLRNIYKKLGVNNRVQAIIRARELNLITTDAISELLPVDAPTLIGDASSISLPEPENPYKGLRAFQMADAHDFFGRDDLVDKLLTRMADKERDARFLAVVGPSGSGKSSLVRAGLIPALRKGKLPGSEKWFTVDLIPGEFPLDELEIALKQLAANQAPNLREQLERDERGLVRVAELILPQDGRQLVVFIDQFEEVFTRVEDETARQHFLDLLRVASRDKRSRVRVIITLRADYYDRPLHYPQFGEMLHNRMDTILPLSAKGLERAISGPADRVGVTFEAGLVAQIVSEMNYQAGALPLLQYALTELFDRRQERELTHEAYREIGGAVGALANRADELFLAMTPDSQELTRQIFLRLVTLGEGTEDTRRRTAFEELLSLSVTPDIVEEIIDTYADYRLLTLDHNEQTRQPTVEVAHEAILREWERLREWLNDSRDDIRQERTLARAADEWDSHNRDAGYLLIDSRLTEFEDWSEQTDMRLTPAAKSFIQASIKEREISHAIEIQRKKVLRYMRYGIASILTIATIISIALSVVAISNERQAVAAREASDYNAEQARQLAQVNGVYAALAQNDREFAIALGIEANLNDDPNPMAFQALADAAYPPGLLRTLSTQYEGVDYNTSANLTITQDGSYLIHPFRTRDGESYVNGVAIYNVNRSSPDYGEQLRVDSNYESSIVSLTLRPDEQYFIAKEEQGRVTIRDFETFEIVYTFEELFNPDSFAPTVFYFNPDGTHAISNDSEMGVYVWDVDLNSATLGQVLAHYTGHHQAPVLQATYNHAGTRIVSSGFDGLLFMYDAETGDVIHTFDGHANPVWVGQFSPDDTRMVSAGFDGTLIIWNVDESSPDFGQEVHRISGHTNLVLQFAFGPDGKTLFVSGWDGRVVLWNIDEGQRQNTGELEGLGSEGFGTIISENWTQLSNGVALSPDGRTGYTAYFGLYAWDLYPGNQVGTYSWGRLSLGASFSPDGDYVAIGAEQNILISDTASGEALPPIPAHDHMIFDLVYSPDGLIIASTGDDGRIVLSDANPQSATFGEIIRSLDSQRTTLELAFSPDGQYLYASSILSGYLIQWDVNTGEHIRTYTINPPVFFRQIDLHPDGRTMAMEYHDENGISVLLYDLATGQEIRLLTGGHSDDINDLKFSHDGSMIASVDASGTLIIWETDTGTMLQQFISSDPLHTVAFHANQQIVYAGTNLGQLIAYNTDTGTSGGSINGHLDIVWDIVTDPSGRFLLSTAGSDATVWRIDNRSDILSWTLNNRAYREMSCSERSTYQIQPFCDEDGILPELDPIVLPESTPFEPIAYDYIDFDFEVPVLSIREETVQTGNYQGNVPVGQADYWHYDGQAGETLTISVVADTIAIEGYPTALQANTVPAEIGFDPFVFIAREDGYLITNVISPDTTTGNKQPYPGSNDRPGDGSEDNPDGDFNVFFEITLPEDGIYSIGVAGWGYMTGGDYTLSITSDRTP